MFALLSMRFGIILVWLGVEDREVVIRLYGGVVLVVLLESQESLLMGWARSCEGDALTEWELCRVVQGLIRFLCDLKLGARIRFTV